MRLFVCMLLLVVAPQSTNDWFKDVRNGNGLYSVLRGCHDLTTPEIADNCWFASGYISGVIDNDRNIRLPDDISWSQMLLSSEIVIVEVYLAKHPERRYLSSVVLIREAFREAGWWHD
jgi:hypothetical protein